MAKKKEKLWLILRIVLLLILIGAVIAFQALGLRHYLTLNALKDLKAALDAYRGAHPLLLAAGYFIGYVLVAAFSLPGAAILTLAGGAIFGLLEGTLLVSFASSIGATLAMLSSRFIFRDAVRERFGTRLQRIDKGLEREGGFYLFSIRLVPLFPFFVVNLLMGLTSLSVATFYWVSQLGMLAGTLVYANAGTRLAALQSLSGLLSPASIGSFLLLALLPWISRGIIAPLRTRRLYKRWKKPRRFERNLVVIGAGASGLVSSLIAATAHAKVTLIEGERMGGDCLNFGCVPTKALIRIARAAHAARHASQFGIEVDAPKIDGARVMDSVRAAIAAVAPHDSQERFEKLGVDVRRGRARIVSPWCVEVHGKPITTRAIVIAASAEPIVPDLPGLADSGYLTSDTLWNLRQLP